jgi:3-deoxy-D-manno-octulosonic acid kinase
VSQTAPSEHPPKGSWSAEIQHLDRETTASARAAFAAGRRSNFSTFVIRPLVGALRGAVRAGPGRRLPAAVTSGYRALVHAIKLWDLERRWREQNVVEFEEGGCQVIALRSWRPVVQSILQNRLESQPIRTGRGGAVRLEGETHTLVARRFRRGGAMRLLGTVYFGRRPRPVREFWLLLAARRRGLPVPEPVAAFIRRLGPFAYRGDLVMLEIPSATPLWEVLRRHRAVSLLERVAQTIRRAHDQGLSHPDLNLNNLLVGADGSVHIVDLDRARLHPGPLGRRARRRSLKRLRRSARKLDPDGTVLADSDLDAIERAYWAAPGVEDRASGP